MTAVHPLYADTYAAARRVIYTAQDDWPAMLAAAETLSTSPDGADGHLARQVRASYAKRLRTQVEVQVRSDLAREAMRRKFVAGYNPDRAKPRDYGLAGVIAVLAVAGWLGVILGWVLQRGWL
jgi:hypothetical protein